MNRSPKVRKKSNEWEDSSFTLRERRMGVDIFLDSERGKNMTDGMTENLIKNKLSWFAEYTIYN